MFHHQNHLVIFQKDNSALETVRSLFSAKTKDFITAVDEKNIILVKEKLQSFQSCKHLHFHLLLTRYILAGYHQIL